MHNHLHQQRGTTVTFKWPKDLPLAERERLKKIMKIETFCTFRDIQALEDCETFKK